MNHEWEADGRGPLKLVYEKGASALAIMRTVAYSPGFMGL